MHDWGLLSQAERDARYNNSAAVANSADFMAAVRAASAERRAQSPDWLDRPYGERERNKVDFYPGASLESPCLVFIHGGYWQRNEREAFATMGDGVRAHGWTYAAPGYTLTPDVSMTEIVRELRRALDLIRAEVKGPIILSGWSAGGHLTAMLLDHPAVQAGLAISGVFELGPIRDTYLNEKAQITEEEARTLSPLRLPVVKKPMAITYGTRELPPLVADSRLLHYKRASEHVPGALIPGAGMNHFTILESLWEKNGLLTRALLDLV